MADTATIGHVIKTRIFVRVTDRSIGPSPAVRGELDNTVRAPLFALMLSKQLAEFFKSTGWEFFVK